MLYIYSQLVKSRTSIIIIRNAMQSLYRALHREGLCTQEESLHTPTRKIKQITDRKKQRNCRLCGRGSTREDTPNAAVVVVFNLERIH